MRLILIRHSEPAIEPEVPIACWGLTDRGIGGVLALFDVEPLRAASAIYSSMQTKSLETAVLIAKRLGIPIRVDGGLNEVTSFTGAFEPDPDVYRQSTRDFYTGTVDRVAGGETRGEAVDRFTAALDRVTQRERDHSTVAVVTHGHVLALVASAWSGADAYALHLEMNRPDIAVVDWPSRTFVRWFGAPGPEGR